MFHVEHVDLIEDVLVREGIRPPSSVVPLFRRYGEMLLDWNQRINLVSKNDEGRLVTRHFLESLGLIKVVPFPMGARVMDLGSGAGFPGIPLKIVRPDLRMVLVESKRKKNLFLRHVVDALGLEDIEAVLGRAEQLEETLGRFDFVVSRSVASLVKLAGWSRAYVEESGGQLIVIKGPGAQKELVGLKAKAPGLGIKDVHVVAYNPFPEWLELKKSVVVTIRWG
jgi:16S rRNA (guanine527-N7)-methyltransferase